MPRKKPTAWKPQEVPCARQDCKRGSWVPYAPGAAAPFCDPCEAVRCNGVECLTHGYDYCPVCFGQ